MSCRLGEAGKYTTLTRVEHIITMLAPDRRNGRCRQAVFSIMFYDLIRPEHIPCVALVSSILTAIRSVAVCKAICIFKVLTNVLIGSACWCCSISGFWLIIIIGGKQE